MELNLLLCFANISPLTELQHDLKFVIYIIKTYYFAKINILSDKSSYI